MKLSGSGIFFHLKKIKEQDYLEEVLYYLVIRISDERSVI